MNSHNYCVILAGGQGKRLWPLSTKEYPKQFLDLFGTGRSLLQATFDRFRHFIPLENIIIATHVDYLDIVQQQLPEIPLRNIQAEPVYLSTAASAAWASLIISQRDEDACIVVSPADHFIAREDRFIEQVEQALQRVETSNHFLALAVQATMPNTAYGYIQKGKSALFGCYTVKSFTEKPDKEFAEMFVESDEFLWNTGLFLWNVRTILPTLSLVIGDIVDNLGLSNGFHHVEEEQMLSVFREHFPSAHRQVLDLMLLEHNEQVLVQECDFGWSDVGCWPQLYEHSHKDADGNVFNRGAVELEGCTNNIITLDKGVEAFIKGLKGYMVVLHDGKLVICPNNNPAEMRKISARWEATHQF